MLKVGHANDGSPVVLTDKERARHIHVLGAIGTGKSKLLEGMIRQDIAIGRGLCLIDPHGTLVDGIEAWCTASGFGRIRRATPPMSPASTRCGWRPERSYPSV
ncbi:MAG TPA: hypothetical protein VG651_05920 [Stellaceae bacterium]|nr:hypothetical protein [Stellaceae bacterium]